MLLFYPRRPNRRKDGIAGCFIRISAELHPLACLSVRKMHGRSLKKEVVALLLLVQDAIVLDFTAQHVLVKWLQHAIEQ